MSREEVLRKQGEWNMFTLITSVYFGKQNYYFLEEDGTVYSMKSGKFLKDKDDAVSEFLQIIWKEDEDSGQATIDEEEHNA